MIKTNQEHTFSLSLSVSLSHTHTHKELETRITQHERLRIRNDIPTLQGFETLNKTSRTTIFRLSISSLILNLSTLLEIWVDEMDLARIDRKSWD
jgi:hypothetical protein